MRTRIGGTVRSLTMLALLLLPAAGARADDDRTLRILIAGDTSFGERYHDSLASRGYEPVLRTRGQDYMIGEFSGILRSADYIVANLETAITDRFPSPYAGERKYLHYGDVAKTPFYLAKYGVDLVSLANNHAFDFGAPGLEQTLELLDARGIDTCGAGPHAAAAAEPHVKRFGLGGHHIHIAFICAFEYRENYDEDYEFYAGDERPGVNLLDTEGLSATVDSLRARHSDLFVVAFPHWGKNYEWATETQRQQAHALVDAGVDLILGHGAHMLQELERHRERWIVYSLGNFVFGSPGRYERSNVRPFGALATLELSLGADGIDKALRLYPIFTDNRLTDYRSRFLDGDEFEEATALLEERSVLHAAFDALLVRGTDEHGFYLESRLAR